MMEVTTSNFLFAEPVQLIVLVHGEHGVVVMHLAEMVNNLACTLYLLPLKTVEPLALTIMVKLSLKLAIMDLAPSIAKEAGVNGVPATLNAVSVQKNVFTLTQFLLNTVGLLVTLPMVKCNLKVVIVGSLVLSTVKVAGESGVNVMQNVVRDIKPEVIL